MADDVLRNLDEQMDEHMRDRRDQYERTRCHAAGECVMDAICPLYDTCEVRHLRASRSTGRPMIGLCVCGHPAGDHYCTRDPCAPGAIAPLEAALQIHACGRCGTKDPSVAGGGTALCYLCAELSALEAPAKERQYRAVRRGRRLLTLTLVAAVAIWLIVAALLRGR
jgi:hypothetical protein